MTGRIEEDPVVRPHECGEDAEVHRVAGGEHEAVVAAQPVEERLFELAMEGQRAVHEPAAGEAAAIALDGVDGRPLYPIVAGEAQVVVGPEHDHGPPVVYDGGAGFAG